MLLKEFTRQHMPPVFEALKATWSLQERLDVQRALKSTLMLKNIDPEQLKEPQRWKTSSKELASIRLHNRVSELLQSFDTSLLH